MTDLNNSTAAAPAAESNSLVLVLDTDKAKAIRSNLGDRSYFVSDEKETAVEKATKHIEVAAAKTDNFYGLSIAIGAGLDTAERILVCTVGVRDKGDASKSIPARNGYKAIVVFQQPSVEEFLNDSSDAAKAFVAKLIEREATDVAFSGIRAVDTVSDLETVLNGLPTTVADLVENSRASGAGDSSFDIMWKDFRAGFIKVKYPELDKVLPQKNEIAKAMRSAQYAAANPATKQLEEIDMFSKLMGAMINAGKSWKNEAGEVTGLDTSDIETWLATRAETVIDFKTPEADFSKLASFSF